MTQFRKFKAEQSGHFAIMFSLLLFPFLIAVGIGIDYSNLLRVQSELQSSADAAVLAVAGKGDTIDLAQSKELADRFIDGNFDPGYSDLVVTRDGVGIEVKAKTRVKMAFGSLIGFNFVDVDALATSDVASASYEIALSLDTTGSMSGGKLRSMKDAVEVMVDNMAAQNPNAGTLKFSVVPFASMVNVGPQFGPQYSGSNVTQQPAAWLDSVGKSPVPQSDLDIGVSRFALYKHLGVVWSGCVESRGQFGDVNYGTTDATPTVYDARTLFMPVFASDEPSSDLYFNDYLPDNANEIGTATPAARLDRYGASADNVFKSMTFSEQIVTSASWIDRGPDPLIQSFGIGVNPTKGPNRGCDAEPILPLTADFDAVKDKVDSLNAKGFTNVSEGLIWGWRTLSSAEPFTEGVREKTVGVQKILVLLTDGSNTLSQHSNSLGSSYSSFGYLVDGRLGVSSGTAAQITEAMNTRTLAICTNAKASGIEIYTIRLEEPDVTTGTMLSECASGPDYYIDVPNRALLDEAFAKIAKKIVRVRLAS